VITVTQPTTLTVPGAGETATVTVQNTITIPGEGEVITVTQPTTLTVPGDRLQSVTVSAQENSVCATWCASNFPNPDSQCTSLAREGKGPCYACGPLKQPSSTAELCNGACIETSNDNQNCGGCRISVSVPRTAIPISLPFLVPCHLCMLVWFLRRLV
jgi:hypothetical protein